MNPSTSKRIGLGLALTVLPVGVVGGYLALNHAERQRDREAAGFDFDLSALKQVDPALITFNLAGRIETQLKSVSAVVALDASVVAVAGQTAGGGYLLRLLGDGGVLSDIALDAAPQALAAWTDGRLLVAMKDHVQVLADGKVATRWPRLTGRPWLASIAVEGDTVFLGDAGNRVVLRCGPDGAVISRMGQRDEARGIDGFVVPSPHLDVAMRAGTLWVANPGRHRVEAYGSDGAMLRWWGAAGADVPLFPGCCNPADFALMADGSFITVEKGVLRVKHYGPDGTLLGVVADPGELGESVGGADVTVQGDRVLLLPRNGQSVLIFSMKERAHD